jgi:hypothetical protein
VSVIALAVSPTVSATLINDGPGWRFLAWTTSGWASRPPLVQPTDADCALVFAEPQEVIQYLRGQYGAQVGHGGASKGSCS